MATAHTARPGSRLSPDDERTAREEFFRRYREAAPQHAKNVPTWVTFSSGQLVDESILSHKEFHASESLLVLFEYLNEMYSATPQEIRDFLLDREPWEDYDMYIFPMDMRWVVAITHEQIDGIHMYITGAVEAFTADSS